MKPKVAFFDFAGCEGDQLQVANLEEELLDLLGQVEVVSFREVMKEHSDNYDIAFIEGSCTRLHDEDRLKQIRKNAKIVVAIGSCATIGGINSLKNYQDLEDVRRTVYGDKAKLFDTYAARPIDAVIPVDAYVHGCPINREEFLSVVKSLLLGKKPEITRAGCDSCCVNEGTKCWGCRGLVDNPNENSQKEVLIKYGLTVDDAINRFKLYFGWQERKK
jgi:sulfhydrogenase subunit delta